MGGTTTKSKIESSLVDTAELDVVTVKGSILNRAAGFVAARASLVLALGALIAVAGAGVVWFGDEGPPPPARVSESQVVSADEFLSVAGAEIMFITETAGGGMLDIRYRVIDPDKALVFHDENLPIALYQDGGVYLERPFHEHSHDVELTPAAIYNELIVNTGSAFHSGDVVSLLVGPYRLDDVSIQ